MKFLLSVLALTFSIQVMAAEVQDVLKELVEMKTYTGLSVEDSAHCSMKFTEMSNGILVTGKKGSLQIGRFIRNNSTYRNAPTYFLSSEYLPSGRDRAIESTFRTNLTNDGRRYMVVAEREVTTRRDAKEVSVACVVDL